MNVAIQENDEPSIEGVEHRDTRHGVLFAMIISLLDVGTGARQNTVSYLKRHLFGSDN